MRPCAKIERLTTMKGNTLKRQILKTAMLAILCGTLVGCGIADVIASLNVGISVLTAAAGVTGLDPAIAKEFMKVSKILTDITAAYDDYEKAESALKPGKLTDLEAGIQTAQADLSQILKDAGVKPPEYLTVAVAVANSAIMALVQKLGSPTQAKLAMARGLAKPLPIISGAKNAKDLKAAWNQAVKAEHPEAVIK